MGSPNYYYLLPVLPPLRWGEPPGCTWDRFQGLCGEWLPAAAARLISGLSLFQSVPAPASNALLARWYAREHALRNALARLRAARAGMDAGPHLRRVPPDPAADRLARTALEADTPDQAEVLLDRGRWRFLEELERGHHFRLENVLGYGLRLRLAWRHQGADAEAGWKRLARCVEGAEALARDSLLRIEPDESR